LKETDTADILL